MRRGTARWRNVAAAAALASAVAACGGSSGGSSTGAADAAGLLQQARAALLAAGAVHVHTHYETYKGNNDIDNVVSTTTSNWDTPGDCVTLPALITQLLTPPAAPTETGSRSVSGRQAIELDAKTSDQEWILDVDATAPHLPLQQQYIDMVTHDTTVFSDFGTPPATTPPPAGCPPPTPTPLPGGYPGSDLAGSASLDLSGFASARLSGPAGCNPRSGGVGEVEFRAQLASPVTVGSVQATAATVILDGYGDLTISLDDSSGTGAIDFSAMVVPQALNKAAATGSVTADLHDVNGSSSTVHAVFTYQCSTV